MDLLLRRITFDIKIGSKSLLTANLENTRVEAANAKRGPTYACPKCQELVVLKKGSRVVHHFAHKKDSSCPYREGESREHMELKKNIYEHLILAGHGQTVLEKVIGRHRTDVYTQIGNNRVAIEVQCSPIKDEDIYDRMRTYSLEGVATIWIFPIRCFLQDEVATRFWWKTIQKLQLGVVYTYHGDLLVQPVRLKAATRYVEGRDWYDPDMGECQVEGYTKFLKRKLTVHHAPFKLPLSAITLVSKGDIIRCCLPYNRRWWIDIEKRDKIRAESAISHALNLEIRRQHKQWEEQEEKKMEEQFRTGEIVN